MPLSDNLVAAWELDEASGNAIDSHGANDLTDVNTVGAGTGLVYGSARDFEADNSEALNIADNTDVSAGDIDLTFEAWVNAESLTTDRVIIGKINSGATQMDYVLRYQSSASRFQWRVVNGSGSLTDLAAGTFGAPSTATWYHIVCWHDATNNQIGIAVNAGTADTAAHNGGVFDGNGGFSIGREGDRLTDYWDGLIGPVRFWKRVLTSDERTELYNSGAGRTYAYIAGGAGRTTRNTRAFPLGMEIGMGWVMSTQV